MANPYEDLIANPYEDLITGEIPKTENFLQKAINNSGGFRNAAVNMAVGGIPSAVNPTSRPEDALPMIAQTGTDFAFNATPQSRALGVIPGVKYGATVGATTAAEGIRQGAKALRGEGGSLEEVKKTGLETAAIEGAFRGGEQLMFRSQIGKDLIKGANKRVGQAVGKLGEFVDQNPGLRVMRDDIVGFLDSAIEKVAPVGPQASALRRMRRFITGLPEELGPQDVQNLKNSFSDIAEFKPEKSGAIKNKAANVAAKQTRGHLKDTLNILGDYADVPISASNKEAQLAQTFYGGSQKKKGIGDIIKKGAISSAVGGGVGYNQKDPWTGVGAGLLTMAGQSEGLRNFLYNLIVKSGASKAGRVGISEAIRQND